MPSIISSMKSKFAKFIDSTVGACLIFFAATAVMRYYTTIELSMFCAVAITAAACLLLKLSGIKKADRQKLSDAANAMFFDFMFSDDVAPVKLLYNGLKAKLDGVKMHGKGVYAGNTAAFCCFSSSPDEKAIARMIAKSKHFGAKKAVILCKTPPHSTVDIDGFTVKTVFGEDVYKLFGSLDALPQKQFSKKHRSRRTAFYGALGKDKILKYALLSAAMFAISVFNGYSVMTFACACLCAALAVISLVYTVTRAVKSKRTTE